MSNLYRTVATKTTGQIASQRIAAFVNAVTGKYKLFQAVIAGGFRITGRGVDISVVQQNFPDGTRITVAGQIKLPASLFFAKIDEEITKALSQI